MSIIKVIKQNTFAQIANKPLQTITDLRAIGLLSNLMSYDENYTIKKMSLYKRFGRAATVNALKILMEEGYFVEVKVRRGSHNYFYYYISDIQFTQEQIQQLLGEIPEKILEVKSSFSVNCANPTIEPEKSIARNQQLTSNNWEGANINNKDIKKKNNKNMNDESCNVDNVNTVLTPPINIDDQLPTNLVDLEESRLNAIKAEYPNINDDWFTQIYSKAKSDGRIKNPIAYVAKSAKKFNDSIKAKELAVKQQQVEKNVPTWLVNGQHKQHESRTEEQQKLDESHFEEEKQKLLSQIGY